MPTSADSSGRSRKNINERTIALRWKS
jgi:hypothetical protein